MNARERGVQIRLKVAEGALDGRGAGDQDVVEAGLGLIGAQRSRQRPKTSAHAIAHDRTAHFFRYGVAKTRTALSLRDILSEAGLQNEGRHAPSAAVPDPKKLASFF